MEAHGTTITSLKRLLSQRRTSKVESLMQGLKARNVDTTDAAFVAFCSGVRSDKSAFFTALDHKSNDLAAAEDVAVADARQVQRDGGRAPETRGDPGGVPSIDSARLYAKLRRALSPGGEYAGHSLAVISARGWLLSAFAKLSKYESVKGEALELLNGYLMSPFDPRISDGGPVQIDALVAIIRHGAFSTDAKLGTVLRLVREPLEAAFEALPASSKDALLIKPSPRMVSPHRRGVTGTVRAMSPVGGRAATPSTDVPPEPWSPSTALPDAPPSHWLAILWLATEVAHLDRANGRSGGYGIQAEAVLLQTFEWARQSRMDLAALPLHLLKVLSLNFPALLIENFFSLVNDSLQRDTGGVREESVWGDEEIWTHLHALRAFRGIVALLLEGGALPHLEAADLMKDVRVLLSSYLRRLRNRGSMWDRVRCKCIDVMGACHVPEMAADVKEDLGSDNPTVIRAAASALQSLVGIKQAVVLLVANSSAAPHQESETTRVLSNALRFMGEGDNALDQVIAALEDAMGSNDEAHAATARRLLSEMGGQQAMKKLQTRNGLGSNYAQNMRDANNRLQSMFENAIDEAKTGFRIALGMDIFLFIVGLALIIAATVGALQQSTSGYSSCGGVVGYASVAGTGALGVFATLYTTLIAKPRRQVKAATDHLIYIKIIFLGYLRELHQSDQAFLRRLMEDTAMSSAELKDFTRAVEMTMEATVKRMGRMLDVTDRQLLTIETTGGTGAVASNFSLRGVRGSAQSTMAQDPGLSSVGRVPPADAHHEKKKARQMADDVERGGSLLRVVHRHASEQMTRREGTHHPHDSDGAFHGGGGRGGGGGLRPTDHDENSPSGGRQRSVMHRDDDDYAPMAPARKMSPPPQGPGGDDMGDDDVSGQDGRGNAIGRASALELTHVTVRPAPVPTVPVLALHPTEGRHGTSGSPQLDVNPFFAERKGAVVPANRSSPGPTGTLLAVPLRVAAPAGAQLQGHADGVAMDL